MIELLADPQVWTAFLTLTLLELVLGIDNIVFISILVERLPEQQRNLARRIGLSLAVILRIGLLFVLAWLIGLSEPLFSVVDYTFSARDLIMIAGGLFLLWKSTTEIHLEVMVAASIVAVALMMVFARPIGGIRDRPA